MGIRCCAFLTFRRQLSLRGRADGMLSCGVSFSDAERNAHRTACALFDILGVYAVAALCAATVILHAADACGAERVKVDVRGVEGDAYNNVIAALVLPRGLVKNGIVDRFWLERFRQRAEKNTLSALEPLGYYQAQVTTRIDSPEDGTWILRVDIQLGPPVLVAACDVTIRGAGDRERSLVRAIRDFPLRKGSVLRHDRYESAKSEMRFNALEIGYLDAAFDAHEIRVNRHACTADITLVLDTGNRYRFGKTELIGADTYPEAYLRRFIAYAEKDYFSQTMLNRTQKNFLDADRFSGVVLTPRKQEAHNYRVPVDISLTPKPTRTMKTGLGYGTDTGARISPRFRNQNAFYKAHEFTTEGVIAQKRKTLIAAYTVPSTAHMNDFTVLRVGFEHEDIKRYESKTFFSEVERVKDLGRRRLGSAYIRFAYEDDTVGRRDLSTWLIYPGVRFSKRGYSDSVRPHSGYFYQLEFRGTNEALGSETSFVQLLGSASRLFSLGSKKYSLLCRAQGGTTLQSDTLKDIPATLRFFAGGDSSVRGYTYKSLGPRDSDGKVAGGKHMLVGSVEIERTIGEDWAVAVFYDAGNAFNSLSHTKFYGGAGIGLRRYTVVGPIKVDIARQTGVSDPSFRLHVTAGFQW
jgi:translocation and assembly module TamA